METKKTQTKKKFVSLAEARPDLAKEWNYEKNGDLRPEDVSCGSNKKIWWIQYGEPPPLISGEQKSNGRLRSSVSGRFRRIETFQIQNYLKGYSQCYRSPCFHLGMPSGFQNYPQGKDRSQC